MTAPRKAPTTGRITPPKPRYEPPSLMILDTLRICVQSVPIDRGNTELAAGLRRVADALDWIDNLLGGVLPTPPPPPPAPSE